MIFFKKLTHIFFVLICTFFTPAMASDRSFDLVAIGEGMVDIVETISDSDLEEIMPEGYKKADTTRIDNQTAKDILGKMNDFVVIPGGSEANMAAYFAALGGRVGFNAVVADDEYGLKFKESLEHLKVSFLSPLMPKKEASTALCITFITPDKERTFAVDASISKLIKDQYINYNAIAQSKLFYTDASNLDDGSNKSQITLKAFNIAKENNVETVFNLNNNHFVNAHRQEILELLPQVDILAGSEEVIKNLFNDTDIDNAITSALMKVKIVVATLGRRGSIIAENNYRTRIKTRAQQDRIIDTTGAGDAYVAGFLFAHIKRKNLKEAGEFGAIVAAQALHTKGGRPEKTLTSLWQEKESTD